MLLSRVGKKSKLTAHQTKNLEIDALVFFSEHFCSRNKRKTNTRKPKQKTNPPSKTVVPSIDSTFSASFFERTADFGHVPGVRLQVLDDFSIACAWTGRTHRMSPMPTRLICKETLIVTPSFVSSTPQRQPNQATRLERNPTLFLLQKNLHPKQLLAP